MPTMVGGRQSTFMAGSISDKKLVLAIEPNAYCNYDSGNNTNGRYYGFSYIFFVTGKSKKEVWKRLKEKIYKNMLEKLES
jgi:hypothetical protein